MTATPLQCHDASRLAIRRSRLPTALVIVTLDESRAGYVALERAIELVRDVNLHVVGRRGSGRPPGVRHRRWLRDLMHEASGLLSDGVSLRGEVRGGALSTVALAVATEIDPRLVVICDRHVSGATAVAIADALSRPVLVARDRTANGRVVAASDMRAAMTPVLAATCRLIDGARDRVTLLHVAQRGFDRTTRTRVLYARQVAAELEDVEIAIEHAADPIASIARFVDEGETDLLAVGHRQRPAYRRRSRQRAEHLVDRCRCSLLVVPIARDFDNC